MKKTKTVKIPARKAVAAKPATTKTVEAILCDICGREVDTSRDYHYCSGGHNCWICDRDICRNGKCFVYEDDPDDFDSSIRICIFCYPLYEKHQSAYSDMINRHHKEIEDFYKMIKKESLQQ